MHLDSAHIAAASPAADACCHVRVCEVGVGACRSPVLVAIALTGDLFVHGYIG